MTLIKFKEITKDNKVIGKYAHIDDNFVLYNDEGRLQGIFTDKEDLLNYATSALFPNFKVNEV